MDNHHINDLLTYGGLRIMTDPHMTETVEDWSRVRSPSRAARRRRQGHPQQISYREQPKREAYQLGGVLVMHPEVYAQLAATLETKEGAA